MKNACILTSNPPATEGSLTVGLFRRGCTENGISNGQFLRIDMLQYRIVPTTIFFTAAASAAAALAHVPMYQCTSSNPPAAFVLA